ncbi:hypothetical protein C9J85_14525 [Haloferax sp. wsp5]|nr:hypothetical protein C9J85_14525 [Haloferax sp. wsp5]
MRHDARRDANSPVTPTVSPTWNGRSVPPSRTLRCPVPPCCVRVGRPVPHRCNRRSLPRRSPCRASVTVPVRSPPPSVTLPVGLRPSPCRPRRSSLRLRRPEVVQHRSGQQRRDPRGG